MLSAIRRAPSAPRMERPPPEDAAGASSATIVSDSSSSSSATSESGASAVDSNAGSSSSSRTDGASASTSISALSTSEITSGSGSARTASSSSMETPPVRGLLRLPDPLAGVRVGLLARLARLQGRIRRDPAGLALGLRLDVGGALLSRLHDRTHLIGGRGGERRWRGLLLSLELRDGLRDLAEVAVDLVRVVSAPRRREVISLDEVAIQFQ